MEPGEEIFKLFSPIRSRSNRNKPMKLELKENRRDMHAQRYGWVEWRGIIATLQDARNHTLTKIGWDEYK